MNCAKCNAETIKAKDGLCRGCRLRANVKTLYPFTAEMDAQLTRLYRGAKNKRQLTASITSFATHYRMPRYIVQNRAQWLNLRTRVQILWTLEQVEYLQENAGTVPLRRMAKRLGRSQHAVKHKLFTLGISSQVVEGYSQKELARNFGIGHERIARWIAKGWLWLADGRVPHEAVANFVWDHMAEYRFAQAEEWWLKVMLNPTLGTAQVRDRKAAA